MNTSAELDIGPLTWVKGEIDLALERAVEALDRHGLGDTDSTHLKAARAHLHQAHGALSIVGFDGVTRFSEALERLLESVEEGRIAYNPAVADATRRAIAAIKSYLEDLIAGQPNQPLRLLPVYRALSEASGQAAPSPADLFFPDLTLRPPRRDQEPMPVEAADFTARTKSARLAYERGLLKLLRGDARGAAEMRSALAAIEATQSQPASRAYWWTALGFLDALAARAVEFDFGTRRVCARIDIQIKRLIEGSRTVAERLMRDTLYYVAIAGPSGDHAECVRAAYRLNELIPHPAGTADMEPLRPILRACRDNVAPAMEDWNRFCAGTAAALPQFHDRVRQLAERVDELKHADLSRLVKAILETADELRRMPLAHNEALGLEMATALLLMDHALESFQHLGSEFAEQTSTIGSRLDAALHGQPLAAMELPHLDEMSRQAQEKLLLAQVAREILTNLGFIEQSLDAFFRDPTRVDELAGLTKPIKQIEGALTVLGQERAVEVLRECEDAINAFGLEADQPRHGEFEEVADKLSALGFFVEQLQHGPADIDRFLRPTSPIMVEPSEVSPEVELERAKRLTKTLVGALRKQPEDETLRGEIRHSLEVVRENAELVDDTALAEQASAAIVAIENEQPSGDIAAAVAQLSPVELPAPPSAQAARLAEASNEEIDAELLGIFIEEAHEVLAAIGGELPKLAAQPHDHDTMTTIRRGFHTLKGSGRMVGLGDLGETAWAVEQVLNRWLQLEQEATSPLLTMLKHAQGVFGDWVVQLESGGGLHHDAAALMEVCELLKNEVGTQPASPPPVSAVVEPLPEFEPELESLPDFEPELEPVPEPVPEPEFESTAELEPEPAPLEPAIEVPTAAPILRLVTASPPEPEGVQVGDVLLSATLYDLYVKEARDYITTLEHELSIGGKPRPSLIRAAHTLAGISATTDISPVHRLAHSLEMALNRLDTASVVPTEGQHMLLARTVGALEGMLGAIANKRMPQNEEPLAADLDALSPVVETPAPPLLAVTDVALLEAAVAPDVPVAEAALTAEALTPPVDEVEAHGERRQLHLPDELDEQLLPIFLEEAVDLMRDVSSGLRTWREKPGDQNVAEQLQRVLHTLKGSARMAGAMSVGELVHSMETRIEQAVSANALTPAFLDTLDASFDRVSMLMERLQSGQSGPPAAEPVAELVVPTTAEATPPVTPSFTPPAAPTVIAAETPRPETPEPDAAARNMLRVRADIVDKLVNGAGEIAIARGRIEGEMRSLKFSLLDLTENVIRLRNQLREIEIQAESQMQSREALAAEKDPQFDPLEFDRFTRFQELTRMMAESVNDVATSQQSLLQNLDQADAALLAQARLSREHSTALMGVRMVPFNTLADRLYRIVRQTAKELDKRANLDIRGGQTELDRSVLEKMTGPIEHLLRNAVAHGLEIAEHRRGAGKTEIGEISLRVGQEGNEIAIELSDDGIGLDFERIRTRGIETGLIRPDEETTPEQLTQLIFQPGFSTAEIVTAISGRGVGMDVVRSEAASLGGRIRVDSTPGQGTRFLIHLPLTLAVTQAVLVKSGGRHYAIPSSMVAQVRELKPEVIAAVRAEGATTWLGSRYPWYYLPRLLGNPGAQPEPARRHWLLLLRAGDQHVAIEVDDLLGNQELVVKNVGPQLARIIGIAGATVLGDGEIVLILNPVALAGRDIVTVSVTGTEEPTATLPPEPVVTTSTAGVVMVVDDSLTVRKITGRLLAREGYHVLMAKDGVDALEQLIDMVPDVMLVDIEMPRMDGFDLTRNVRADERLKKIPIIMITSRIADKHRNYAREIGVNHYLGKPYDEDELLKLIGEYTRKGT
jgi:chemosensory pili system protein ChpA (sensor histidine kinase/response regulator)